MAVGRPVMAPLALLLERGQRQGLRTTHQNLYGYLNLGFVNAFLIEDISSDPADGIAPGLTLVDTGTPGNLSRIVAQLKKAGKDPRDIRRIIVTHAHTDTARLA